MIIEAERDELRVHAKEKIVRVQEQNKTSFNRNRKEVTEYRLGQLVAIKRTQPAPGLKFHPKHTRSELRKYS